MKIMHLTNTSCNRRPPSRHVVNKAGETQTRGWENLSHGLILFLRAKLALFWHCALKMEQKIKAGLKKSLPFSFPKENGETIREPLFWPQDSVSNVCARVTCGGLRKPLWALLSQLHFLRPVAFPTFSKLCAKGL